MYSEVELPYEPSDFKVDELWKQIILTTQFRRECLFNDQLVNKVLKLFQRPLIAIFMTLAGRNP